MLTKNFTAPARRYCRWWSKGGTVITKRPDYDLLARGVVDLVTTDPNSRIDLSRRMAFEAELVVNKLMDYESAGFVIRRITNDAMNGSTVFVRAGKEMRFRNLDFARRVRDAYIAKFPAAKLQILQMVE